MKAKDMRDMTTEELVAKLDELEQELADLTYRHGKHELDDTARLKYARRDIARARTILDEQQKNSGKDN